MVSNSLLIQSSVNAIINLMFQKRWRAVQRVKLYHITKETTISERLAAGICARHIIQIWVGVLQHMKNVCMFTIEDLIQGRNKSCRKYNRNRGHNFHSAGHSFLSKVGLWNHWMRRFLEYEQKMIVLVMNISNPIEECQRECVQVIFCDFEIWRAACNEKQDRFN